MKPTPAVNYAQPTTPQPKGAFITFEDLEVYRLSRQFRKAMYGVTRRLPAFEKFELASQIRRAAVSLTNTGQVNSTLNDVTSFLTARLIRLTFQMKF